MDGEKITFDGQPPTDKQKYEAMDLSYIKARWNNRAYNWEQEVNDFSSHLNRGDSYNRFIEILGFVINNMDQSTRKILIELGCGTGLVLERFSSLFQQCVGIDISENMLDVARSKKIGNAVFINDNVFDYLCKNAEATMIVSRGVLLSHYGQDLAVKLLELSYNSLKRGGKIFFDMINATDADRPKQKTAYTANEMVEIAEKIGFKNIRVYGEVGYPLLYLEAEK